MRLVFEKIIFIPLLIIIVINVSGQIPLSQDVMIAKKFVTQIEVSVGPSLSSLRGNPGVDNDSQNSRKPKVGYSFGVGLIHSLSKKIDVTGQLLYERKGGKSETITTYFDEETQTFINGRADSDYSYDYYTLPLVFRYAFDKKNRIKCGLGPYISYLHKQTLTVNNYFHNRSNSSFSDQTELNSKFDFGFSGEILYSIPLSSHIALNLQLNHKTGLKNVRPMISNPYSMKTNNTSFLIGIIINR